MSEIIKAHITDVIADSIRASLYANMWAILGSGATIFPMGDPKHGALDTTTFTSVGDEQVTVTYSEAPASFDNAPSTKGIIPVVTFNGTDEEADSPDATAWSTAAGFSVGAWINLNTAASNVILAKWDETTGAELREWRFAVDSNGDAVFEVYDESADSSIGRKIDTALSTATWTHIVATFNGGTSAGGIILYKDGVAADDTNVNTGATFANSENLATVLSFGYEEDSAGAKANFFDGSIAGGPLGIFFVNTALSADNVKMMYEIGRRALDL